MDYAPNTDAQLTDMLHAIGVDSFDQLLASVPAAVRQRRIDVPSGLAEADVLALCEGLAARNRPAGSLASFLGAGAYRHLIPTVVDALAARGEWLTPYTPYQAEASQGTLQAIYEFQTMVCELLQMDVANASLYDGASSLAEAALLTLRATEAGHPRDRAGGPAARGGEEMPHDAKRAASRSPTADRQRGRHSAAASMAAASGVPQRESARPTERPRLLVSEAVHPHARQVLATYLIGTNAVVQEIPTVNGVTDVEALGKALRDDVAAVIMQQPNVFGVLEPMAQASQAAHRAGALFVSSVYPISLGLLQPPGSYGADIAVAEGRCLGSPASYGGPGLGLFTTTQALLRRVPGRLAGCTVDQAGKRGFTLTLQTREQHIRRERATSNICTNEGWLALRATIFMSLMGPHGLQELARMNLDKAHYAFERLTKVPWIQPVFDQPFFNEFTLRYAGHDPATVNKRLAKVGIIGGLPLKPWYPTMDDVALWCVTEQVSREAIDRTAELLERL